MLFVSPSKIETVTEINVEKIVSFEVTNTGSEAITINEVRNGCVACATYDIPKYTISPNETIQISIGITADTIGIQAHQAFLVYGPENLTIPLTTKLTVIGKMFREGDATPPQNSVIVPNNSAKLKSLPRVNLGQMAVNTSKTVKFPLTNTSATTITITSINLGCHSCTTYTIPKMTIDPNETIELEATFTPTSTGAQSKFIDVVYGEGTIRLIFMANVIN